MAERNYIIDFFSSFTPNDIEFNFHDFLENYLTEGCCPPEYKQSFDLEVRHLRRHEDGVISGVFAKIRKDHLPHAGRTGQQERELDLEDDEGLVEKNHFLAYRENSLLVMQANRHAGTAIALGHYLSRFAGHSVAFDPVLQPDAMQRLMRGDLHPVSVQAGFARPTNPDLYPEDDWSEALMDLLSGAGGSYVKLSINSDLRSDDDDTNRLKDAMRHAWRSIKGMPKVRSLKMDMANDDGIVYPIDLIADRLKDKVTVDVRGRYPIESDMFTSMAAAKEGLNDSLESIFGNPSANLA
ncbi:DUF6731 family protein [uncultured Halomonas sp.]|uniref:DUF6731 family protein n=1 Tax=uncultured Halomonas sp. TaxID=173971 RepID=UPI0026042848|nr:DUF6731 family protein [uncultured Halomonas sp.]